MGEKKKPESKVEPVDKRTFKEKIYNFFDDWLGEGYRKRTQEYWCRADLDDLRKSEVSTPLGITGYLSPRDAVKLMYSNDLEVRKLQRIRVINTLRGVNDPDDEMGWGAAMRKALQDGTDKPFDEVCKKGVPKYIYEPNVRYKRIENPDCKRHKNYSIAGTLTGVGMLATGLASGLLPLAYSGAALALASLGYRSGQWVTNRKEDQSFEKLPSSLSELEKNVKGPVQKAVKEPKDNALYVRRLYYVVPPREPAEGGSIPFHYSSIDSWKHPTGSNWGWLGVGLTALCLASAAVVNANSAVTAAQSLAAAGSIGLATLGHYAGYIFGDKHAKPEYQKV